MYSDCGPSTRAALPEEPSLGAPPLGPLGLPLKGLINVHPVQQLGLLAKLCQLLVEVNEVRTDIVALFLEKDDIVILLELKNLLVQVSNGLLQLG